MKLHSIARKMKIKRFLYPVFGLVTYLEVFELPSNLSKRDLVGRFTVLSDAELTVSGAFMQSVKVSS